MRVVVFADDQTTHHYAAIFRQLRKQGTPIPTGDMWLAALMLQHNLACTHETSAGGASSHSQP